MSQEPPKPAVPEPMDRWTRNARLYETLKAMGLFVSAVPEAGDASRISHIIVAADQPFAAEIGHDAANARIASAVQKPEVGDVIVSRARGAENVIDFPAQSR